MSRSYPRVVVDPSRRHFEIVIDIAASPQRVWSVTSDVEAWPEWTASVLNVRRLDQGKFRVGSRARIRQPGFLPAVWEVIKLDEGRSFTWMMRSPGLQATGHHGVARTPGGSRATLSLTYSGPFAGIVTRLLGVKTERFLALEAAGLKKRSEER